MSEIDDIGAILVRLIGIPSDIKLLGEEEKSLKVKLEQLIHKWKQENCRSGCSNYYTTSGHGHCHAVVFESEYFARLLAESICIHKLDTIGTEDALCPTCGYPAEELEWCSVFCQKCYDQYYHDHGRYYGHGWDYFVADTRLEQVKQTMDMISKNPVLTREEVIVKLGITMDYLRKLIPLLQSFYIRYEKEV
jgi:hypothetical protein